MKLSLEGRVENGEIQNSTLEELRRDYGYLKRVEIDLKYIEEKMKESGYKRLMEKKYEKWLGYKKEIVDRINFLLNSESKYVLKVEEHFKEYKEDTYFIRLSILKVVKDSNVLIDYIYGYKLFFKQRGKIFNSIIEEIFNKYKIEEIYSNKDIKNHHCIELEELKIG